MKLSEDFEAELEEEEEMWVSSRISFCQLPFTG